jgi:hypothetical protein
MSALLTKQIFHPVAEFFARLAGKSVKKSPVTLPISVSPLSYKADSELTTCVPMLQLCISMYLKFVSEDSDKRSF